MLAWHPNASTNFQFLYSFTDIKILVISAFKFYFFLSLLSTEFSPILFLKKYCLLVICGILLACMSLDHVIFSAQGSQKRLLHQRELELQMVVSQHMGTGN